MSLPSAREPASLPLHVLFPDEYAATKRRIIRDFALLGTSVVLMLIGVAAFLG